MATSASCCGEGSSSSASCSSLARSPSSWDAFAEEYERRVEPFTSKFAEEMIKGLLRDDDDDDDDDKRSNHPATASDNPKGKRKLLDVGCGTGAVSLLAVSKGLDVVATDVSKAMVDRTKARVLARIQGLPQDTATTPNNNVVFDSAVAQGQDLPSHWSESFDLVAANFSVIFFPQPSLGLREIWRCLQPGTGIVSFTAWGDATETPAFRVFPDVLAKDHPELVQTNKPKRITGSVEVLTNLLEEAGFVDIRVEGPIFKTLTVHSPSEYYDRFALTSPPTVAMIAKMEPSTRSTFRERVMEVARARGGREDGSVALESGAYIAYGRKPFPKEEASPPP